MGWDRLLEFRQSIRGNYLYLLASLIFVLLVIPILIEHDIALLFFELFITISLLMALVAACDTRNLLIVGLVLAITVFLTRWGSYIWPDTPHAIVSDIVAFVFYFYIASLLLRDILHRQRRVTANLLYGAVCIYLLFGIAWTFVYGTLELVTPGSIVTNGMALSDVYQGAEYNAHLLYFSFVTISTLGYGDISPVTIVAGTAAYFEAISGQIYLVIVVARLVSLYVAGGSTNKEEVNP